MKRLWILLIYSLIIISLSSCIWLYSTRPGNIPPHIKSVAINETKNSTAEFNLGQDFTDLLIAKMQLENLLPIDDASVAYSIIYTNIKSLSDAVFSYDENVVVKEYKLSMNIDFSWFDTANDLDLMKNTLSEYEIYYSDTYNSTLSDDQRVTRDDALELLMDKLGERVITELTSQW
jgi:hypothetical protein